MLETNLKDKLRYRLWSIKRDFLFWSCTLTDHTWTTYLSRGMKTGRDGISRDHTYTNWRCSRCSLEWSCYTEYPIPRSVMDRIRSTITHAASIWRH